MKKLIEIITAGSSFATEKQLKYLSFLTKHDWTKLYVPFYLASELIEKAKNGKSYAELKKIYDNNGYVIDYHKQLKNKK